jgi:predicted ATP-binding protein involved in virulence
LKSSQGCRYGLIGDNGSGKSNVLAAIAARELPLPAHVDVFLLHEEAPPTEQSGVEAVIAHVVEEARCVRNTGRGPGSRRGCTCRKRMRRYSEEGHGDEGLALLSTLRIGNTA